MAQLDFGEQMNEFQGSPATAGVPAQLEPVTPPPSADPDEFVQRLRTRFADRIVGEFIVPARPPRLAPFPAELDPRIVRALAGRGIESLYHHQALVWEHVRANRHTVVVTPTASGKSLCYNLPAVQSALAARAKSLYLFPTKALAQDQVAELHELSRAGSLGIRAYTFDGDTPGDARRAVRTLGDIVVSNPDMLHQAILPHHTKWAQFFESLRYIVIDELHTYRGVFGAHMANLLRRLARICRFYRAEPVFIMTSATIANPGELAERLIGAPVHAVTESGAPQGRKQWLVWNPPVVDADLGLRASARSQSTLIACQAIEHGLKTIVFANSRLEVEVITKYLKDAFDRDPRRRARVAAYRGGYLPTERREKEGLLRRGALDCVVSTSALELGVDIGALDVAILNGYPGSIAAALQRFGRAGRRQRTAVGILVATSNLLDQYVARNPEFFLGASPEYARIDPEQLLVQMDHVRCAAFELPFRNTDEFGVEPLAAQLDYLGEQGVVHREGPLWHWSADSYPANSVSLRTVTEGNFVVVDTTAGAKRIIAEVDHSSAALTLYEGAIYMVQAAPWQVERLDWVGRKAYVRKVEVDYYTDAIDYTKLKVLDDFDSATRASGTATHGEVHIVRRVAGYKKIRYYTHENIGYGHVHLPDHEMHTTAVWWTIAPQALAAAFASRHTALDGFLGAAYTLHHIAALRSLAEIRDIGRAVGDGNGAWSAVVEANGRGVPRSLNGAEADLSGDTVFRPTVFLYDNYPGGIGLAAPLYDERSTLVREAWQLVHDCRCAHGCPACIGPVLPRAESSGVTPKAAALGVLELLAGGPIENDHALRH